MQQLELIAQTERRVQVVEPGQPNFHVFDGHTLVAVEAASEDDARCLCAEMAWEFVCACD